MCSYISLMRIAFASIAVLVCAAAINVSERKTCLGITLSAWRFRQYFTLKEASSMCVIVENVSSEVRYFLIEVHSQRANITLSYVNSGNATGNFVTGTSIGLVSNSLINKRLQEIFWIFNKNPGNVTVLLSIVCYGGKDPIPGGCNMEFPIEISPFLRLDYNRITTKLQFQYANVGYPPKTQPPLCSNTSSFLRYKVYVYYLPEGDFSETALFEALEHMQDVTSIKASAVEVMPYKVAPKTQTVFMTYPGQGVIYSIIVHDENNATSDAAYVPISTYGCDFDSKVDNCEHLTSSFAKVLSLVMAVIGLIICMRGHRYLTLDMAFFGFLAFALIAFIIIARSTTLKTSDRDVVTVVVGIVGAIAWSSIWWFFGIPVISTLLVGFVLGFLLMSMVFFTPAGDFEILRNNMNYWMILASGMLIVPIVLLPLTKFLNILAASVVGSYATIIACDRYLGTTLSCIILNVVKRAVFEDVYLASNAVPFQRNDIILSVIWAMVIIAGVALQFYTERRRAPFPPTPFKVWKQSRIKHREVIQRHLSRNQGVVPEVVNERTPLLSQSSDALAANRVQYTANFLGTI